MRLLRRTLGVLVSTSVVVTVAVGTVAGPAQASTHYGTAMVKTQKMTGPTLRTKQDGWWNKGQRIKLNCYTRGQNVKGYYSSTVGNGGWDNIWYRSDHDRWVADVDINTGVNGPVTGKCGGSTPKPPSSSGRLNAAIASKAKAARDGSYGGQCAIWAEGVIRRAGGPQVYLGSSVGGYQAAWSRYATRVGSSSLKAGDIVQFVSGRGPHTSIVISGSSVNNAKVKYSNYLGDERVHTATLKSQVSYFGSGTYKIWRIK